VTETAAKAGAGGPFDLEIEAGRGGGRLWGDLWRYRELFYFLAWRDVLVRYKQTAIGVAWAVLRPFLAMVVFTVVFGRLAKFPSDGAPYPILVFAAMLPWQLFSNALQESSNSLIGNSALISKIYFPRLIVPASAVAVSLVDFLISFSILVALMFWYGFVPGWRVLFLPLFTLLVLLLSLGAGFWFSAISVKYRDFRYVVPFVVQFGLYVSPVGFSSGVVPDSWRLLYSLNPMVGVIDGFRWALIGGASQLYMPGFLASIGLTAGLSWYGLVYFRRTEKFFADII